MTTDTFTLSIFTENSPGVLQRITVVFTRRKLNIESLTVCETEVPGVSRFTIVVRAEGATIAKVAGQLRRIIDVHDVRVSTDDELIVAEVAMYKVGARTADLRAAIERYGLKVSFEGESYTVLSITGTEFEIDAVRGALEAFGLIEFIRSGRVALRREGLGVKDFLRDNASRMNADANDWI